MGLRAGQVVLVKAPREKIRRFGFVVEACRHDGGIVVRLSDDGPIARYFCVRPELGDSVEELNVSQNPEPERFASTAKH